MFSTTLLVVVITLYMALLFAVAQFVEKRVGDGKRVSPYVYVLAITVYTTSWGFYGSVGFAAESGWVFFAVDLGAILAILTWWRTLRPMVRIKECYRVTSIADFIAARYNRSQAIAALVTLLALVGIVPYIALQLKSIVDTLSIISPLGQRDWGGTGLLVTLAMVFFTIFFGARRLDPTERHEGVLAVLAVQSLVKLVAFLTIGLFVTYGLYRGLGSMLQLVQIRGLTHLINPFEARVGIDHWLGLIALGVGSIFCLPHLFHVSVVENSDQRDIRKVVWLIPLYMVVINLFVIPIAAGGLMKGLSPAQADEYVLWLPHMANKDWLALLTFIGGFSAASGMVILSTMTLATMATNHLLMPCIEGVRSCNFLRQYLLPLRWLMILLIVLCGYAFAWAFNDAYMLAALGMISFVAVMQFVPVLFGGLYWRGANRAGAILGLLAGALVWGFTLVLPAFSRHAWAPPTLMSEGLWQIGWLRPEALFGLEGLTPVTHSILWSLLFNTLFFVLGSWLFRASKQERTQLGEFMSALALGGRVHRGRPTGLEAYVPLQEKCREAVHLLADYLPEDKAEREVERIAEMLHVRGREEVTIIELMEFHRLLENLLAGSIGAAGAHRAIETRIGYSEREKRDLRAIYSHIMAELQEPESADVASAEAPQKDIRYSFVEELQATIERQKQTLASQEQTLQQLTAKLDRSDRELFEQRVQNQKLTQELRELHKQLESHLHSG